MFINCVGSPVITFNPDSYTFLWLSKSEIFVEE